MRQEVYLEEIVGAIFVILDVWKSVMAEKADEAIWQSVLVVWSSCMWILTIQATIMQVFWGRTRANSKVQFSEHIVGVGGLGDKLSGVI